LLRGEHKAADRVERASAHARRPEFGGVAEVFE
jgi:hypothetical protein